MKGRSDLDHRIGEGREKRNNPNPPRGISEEIVPYGYRGNWIGRKRSITLDYLSR